MHKIQLLLYTEHRQPPVTVKVTWPYAPKRGELITYEQNHYLVNNIVHDVDKHTVNISATLL